MSGTKRGRILIVDDEPSLLGLLEKYLTRLGYDVVACSSAREAWEQFERESSTYALVLADVTLREMSGAELVTKMLGLSPSLRGLLSSGYAFDTSTLRASVRERVRFLKKPFLPSMLVENVEALLEGSSK